LKGTFISFLTYLYLFLTQLYYSLVKIRRSSMPHLSLSSTTSFAKEWESIPEIMKIATTIAKVNLVRYIMFQEEGFGVETQVFEGRRVFAVEQGGALRSLSADQALGAFAQERDLGEFLVRVALATKEVRATVEILNELSKSKELKGFSFTVCSADEMKSEALVLLRKQVESSKKTSKSSAQDLPASDCANVAQEVKTRKPATFYPGLSIACGQSKMLPLFSDLLEESVTIAIQEMNLKHMKKVGEAIRSRRERARADDDRTRAVTEQETSRFATRTDPTIQFDSNRNEIVLGKLERTLVSGGRPNAKH
jgi:hypothetical protein